MKRTFITFLLGIIGFIEIYGQVTYSEHIAPIIYDNCTSCHRPGEIGPISLTNYGEVAQWSGMVEYVTEIKYMPPWKPDRDYSRFVGESGLTVEEIQLIADWVAAGSPQGDPSLEPPIPDFPTGSQLGIPDVVLEMAEEYFIEGNNQDDYRVFVLPTGFEEDKEIAAIEFRPGNKKAVHHALIAYETEGLAAAKDAETPGYGYESFGDFGVRTQGTFTSYTPGIKSILFPEGIGTTLPAGADIVLQIHYAPLSTDETDKSLVNVFFKKKDDPIIRELQRNPVSPFDLDGGYRSFSIPPDQISSFHGTKEVTEDISLISVYPHCHYLGKEWELFAETPSNDTINIIRINDWDFNWQGSYTFNRMKKIPSGSIIHINATYDNTINNPFNPSNPPQRVGWGEGTKDEMYLVGMEFVPYQEGDENIVIGQDITTSIETIIDDSGNRLFPPFPNPASEVVILNYYLKSQQNVSIELFDIRGTLVKTMMKQTETVAGNHSLEFSVNELLNGVYMIRLGNSSSALTSPLVISR